MGCEPLELPKYFSSPKELTMYVKKLLGVKEWKKRRTYSIGHGLRKKLLVANNVKVEIVYRVIEEQREWSSLNESYVFEVRLNKYVSVVSALICKEGEGNG